VIHFRARNKRDFIKMKGLRPLDFTLRSLSALKRRKHRAPADICKLFSKKTGRAINARPAWWWVRVGRLIILRRMLRRLTVAGRTTFALLTLRARRAQLVLRQFAVAVFIERFQRSGGIRDFGLVDHTVMIRVQRLH
jgi:hypothetical protein